MEKVIKLENGMWMTTYFAEGLKNLTEISNIRRAHLFLGIPLSEEEEDKLYTDRGLTPPDRTPKRKGHFFMAHIGENSCMLFNGENGSVYKIHGHPCVENVDTEPFTGEWKYWRAVSGFDF